MCDCLKSSNKLVNTMMYVGAKSPSQYDYQSEFRGARLIYIPTRRIPGISHIPALFEKSKHGDKICVYFHGNACDISQVSYVSNHESAKLRAHYLILEYPGYGIARGKSTEETIRMLALDALDFIEGSLQIPADRIVILGRSIGTGPACYLAAELTKRGKPPAALVLHSPYTSIRDLTTDLVASYNIKLLLMT